MAGRQAGWLFLIYTCGVFWLVASCVRAFLLQDPIEKKTPSDLGFSNLFEVTDQTPQQVQATIEKVAAEAIDEVLEGNGLRYALAQRGTGGTTVYVKELDRNYLEYKQMMREFSDASQVKRTTMMTRLMQVRCAHTSVPALMCTCLRAYAGQGPVPVFDTCRTRRCGIETNTPACHMLGH